jgi:SAM-dependent methyltransferase
LWKVPLGTAFGYGYGRLAYNSLSNLGIQFPEEHERRVQSTIARTLSTAAATTADKSSTLRVLEVGVGTDCRLARRGLYQAGLEALEGRVERVELVGVDLQLPKPGTLDAARRRLEEDSPLPVDLAVLQQSITSRLPYADGSFDAIVCCLTLCSVDEPALAVQEMRRLLKADGGTLGFVEHVAVNPDEPYRWLEGQQKGLDSLQQAVADNCHLHRYSGQTLVDNLGPSVRVLDLERFLVDAMWPVNMQACGVLQRYV